MKRETPEFSPIWRWPRPIWPGPRELFAKSAGDRGCRSRWQLVRCCQARCTSLFFRSWSLSPCSASRVSAPPDAFPCGRPSHHFVSLPHHLSPSLSLNHLQPTRKPTSLAPVQLILLFSSFMHHGISSQRIMLSRPPTRQTLSAGNREVTGHFEASSRLPSTPLDPCPAQPKRVVLCHRSHAESLTWEPGCKVTSHCVAVALSRHLVRRAHGDSDGGVWRGSHLVSIRSRSATPPRPPHPTDSSKGQQKTPWLVPVGHVVRDGGYLGPLLDLV